MNNIAELVERLRDYANLDHWPYPKHRICVEAADLIEHLSTTIAEKDAEIAHDWVADAATRTMAAADTPPGARSVRGAGIEHAAWMLGEITSGKVAGNKAHRWLGYAQGLLVAAKWLTLDEAKIANKEASDALSQPPSGAKSDG